MAKYNIDSLADLEAIKQKHITEQKNFSKGDIIVHKPFTFAEIQSLIKREYANEIELFPASPGTPVFTINGYNTSVVEVGAMPILI